MGKTRSPALTTRRGEAEPCAPEEAGATATVEHIERIGGERRSRLAPMLHVAAGVAIALAVFELIVRQFYYMPWAIDEDFGTIVKPGTTVRYWREGRGVSHWIDHGVRRVKPIPNGIRPILVLGDSFTEAFMVSDGEVFTDRLEAGLRADKHPIPVVNLGKGGSSAADYIGFADRNRRFFDPRWTIVQLRDSDLTDDAWAKEKPHLVREESRLVAVTWDSTPDWGVAHRLFWWMRQRSALLNFAVIRLQEFARGTEDEPPLFRAADAAPKVADQVDPQAYPVEDTFDALVAAYGGRLTILYLPDFDPKRPLAATPVEEMIERRCAARHLSCVNLRQIYPQFALDHRSPFGFPNSGYNVGHMNVAGHREAADLLRHEIDHLIDDAVL